MKRTIASDRSQISEFTDIQSPMHSIPCLKANASIRLVDAQGQNAPTVMADTLVMKWTAVGRKPHLLHVTVKTTYGDGNVIYICTPTVR